MSTQRVGVGVGLAVPVAIYLGSLIGSPLVALAIVAGALLVGWRRIPRFWRSVGRGLVAGGLAGLLVLGPGFRLAMRVVAIADPIRRPEFTIEGTGFLVVGIGLFFGAVTGGWATLVSRGIGLPRWGGAALVAGVTLVSLFSDGEVIRELTELGGGAWMNVPMFLAVTGLYAYLTDRWARPEASRDRAPDPGVIEPLAVS